ncbi:MAG TPA: DUF1638 domain-containing protein [Thermohalobaculum sp.]|nr:DUF1638 domain-containing protein [Thermohalobaculum sp.]
MRQDPADAAGRAGEPSDRRLTEEGTGLGDNPGRRVLVIACGALAREILAIRRLNGWDRLELTCLPAILHNRPERIVPALRARVAEARARGWRQIVVGYADCGTGGGIDRFCAEEGLSRIDGPHCYSFFDGNAAFAAQAEDEITAFYLTDFLARQFDTLVWQGMGLDRHPELRDMMFGNYDRLVYIAQTEDPALENRARAAAERLGLRFEMRRRGYGDLVPFLAGAVGD